MEIQFDEIEIGKRYRVTTIGRGYGYRLRTSTYEGVAVATRRDSVTGTPVVRLQIAEGRTPLVLINLWGIETLPE